MNNIGLKLIYLVYALFLLSSREAYAYVDPGTGSYFFQLFAAFLFAAIYPFKLGLEKIKIYLSKKEN